MKSGGRGFFLFLNYYRWLNWLLAVILLYVGATPEFPPHLTLIVYTAVFAYNLLFTVWPDRVENFLRKYPPAILIDVLFCSWLMYIYGWRSPFTVYSFSPVMLGGHLFKVRGSFLVAALTAAGYTVSVAVNGYTWAEISKMGWVDSHLFQIFDYFIVAIFFSYPAVLAEQLRKSNAELLGAQDEIARLTLAKERRRLAGDMHDNVTQSLLSVKLLLDASIRSQSDPKLKRRLMLAKDAAAKALEEMRLVINDLFEDRFDRQHLCELVRQTVSEATGSHGIAGEVRIEGVEARIDSRTKKALYLILAEALHNVIKHAGAAKVEVALEFNERSLVLEVRDNGVGLKDGGSGGVPGGYGLSLMSSRAACLGGTCRVASHPAGGTRVLVEIPTMVDAEPAMN